MYWQSVARLVSPGGILVSFSIQIEPGSFFLLPLLLVYLWLKYELSALH
jgi:hypothetical protein